MASVPLLHSADGVHPYSSMPEDDPTPHIPASTSFETTGREKTAGTVTLASGVVGTVTLSTDEYLRLVGAAVIGAAVVAPSAPAAGAAGVQTVRFRDGAVYTGQIQNGKPHGRGEMKYARSNEPHALIEYTGEFANGKREGKGTSLQVDGTEYFGNWENSQKNGLGKSKYPDGSIYDGHFQTNLRHGYGTWQTLNGHKYIGMFAKDKMEGEGIYHFNARDYKKGEFKDNELWNGKHRFFNLDSSSHVGFRTYTYSNGECAFCPDECCVIQ